LIENGNAGQRSKSRAGDPAADLDRPAQRDFLDELDANQTYDRNDDRGAGRADASDLGGVLRREIRSQPWL
jgi:hypothetical protein